MKKFVAIMLTAAMLLCASPSALAVNDNPEGTTVQEVAEDDKMVNNHGTIKTNEGEVDINLGTVETNNNLVDTNNGGTIKDNNGYVDENVSGGTIENNNKDGVVDDNSFGGVVQNNSGTVVENGGTVEENSGTVEGNLGTVNSNKEKGTVKANSGNVVTNEQKGTVELNAGQVWTNNGTVEDNGGCVYYNYGTVEYNGAITVEEGGEVYTVSIGSLVMGNDGVVKTNDACVANISMEGFTQTAGTVETNNGIVLNYGVVKQNSLIGSESYFFEDEGLFVMLNEYDGTLMDGNGNEYDVADTDYYTYNGTVINYNLGVVEQNYGIVYNGTYTKDGGEVTYTSENNAVVSFQFVDEDKTTELKHIYSNMAFDADTYDITANAEGVDLPTVTKKGYKLVEWVGYVKSDLEDTMVASDLNDTNSTEIHIAAGEKLFDINYAMQFFAVWEKLEEEESGSKTTSKTTSETTSVSTTRDSDSHGIWKSNTFFFKRKPKNFEGIKVGNETLVEGEDFILTAVARNEDDTELTATQIEFTDKFFEKYGIGLTEIYLTFVDQDYVLYATNDAALIQVCKA